MCMSWFICGEWFQWTVDGFYWNTDSYLKIVLIGTSVLCFQWDSHYKSLNPMISFFWHPIFHVEMKILVATFPISKAFFLDVFQNREAKKFGIFQRSKPISVLISLSIYELSKNSYLRILYTYLSCKDLDLFLIYSFCKLCSHQKSRTS